MEKERRKEQKRERERGARGGKSTSTRRFTSDSMTLRGPEGPMELDGVCALTHAELLPSRRAKANAMQSPSTGCGLLSMEIVSRLRRVIGTPLFPSGNSVHLLYQPDAAWIREHIQCVGWVKKIKKIEFNLPGISLKCGNYLLILWKTERFQYN
jgi:hypothetical protein